MVVLNGKEVSQFRRAKLAEQIKDWVSKGQPQPGLAVVIVGDDPASHVYVNLKAKACEKVGIQSWVHRMPADVSNEELKKLITSLNEDSSVHGILVQIPLPKKFNEDEVIGWVDPGKDADGLSIVAKGELMSGHPKVMPCTPSGVMSILEYYKINVEGLNAVVVGRSQIVGLPMAQLLQQANATVTICHSRTKNLAEHTKNADLVVVAAGKPRFLGKDDFKEGSIVVDVGIHRIEGNKISGDVRYEELEGHVQAATPVPGGVGPMTITTLLENTCRIAGMTI